VAEVWTWPSDPDWTGGGGDTRLGIWAASLSAAPSSHRPSSRSGRPVVVGLVPTLRFFTVAHFSSRGPLSSLHETRPDIFCFACSHEAGLVLMVPAHFYSHEVEFFTDVFMSFFLHVGA
jgi:hypothetical protein